MMRYQKIRNMPLLIRINIPKIIISSTIRKIPWKIMNNYHPTWYRRNKASKNPIQDRVKAFQTVTHVSIFGL